MQVVGKSMQVVEVEVVEASTQSGNGSFHVTPQASTDWLWFYFTDLTHGGQHPDHPQPEAG